MKPSTGRVIITKGVVLSNGTNEHPAIITRVWGAGDTKDAPVCVNASTLPDGSTTVACASSIMLFEDRAAAEAAFQSHGGRVAFWPDRV